ncbi:hypothetical protein HPB49_012250 [Dermacentor silvarum]|uniref:Uncharacterized protein n=1 Tax=Dermacentor silvarum TaxID=543639 RepID=A0ACB8C3J2_DERSI|nr:hypothetical protein HPB49_012250 [Dermacentor silvarum]
MAQHRNTIWQWNCRGCSRKRAVLQLFLTNGDKLEVMVLKECGKNAKLASYKSYAGRWDNTQVVTLVKRNVTVLQHETGSMQMDHVLIELVPRRYFSSSHEQARNVNWHAFRDSWSGQDGIEDVDEWSTGVIQSVHDATEEIEGDENQERVDRHMMNLWRKKQELNLRLAQKRGDRNFRRQLAALNKEIEQYALTLTK